MVIETKIRLGNYYLYIRRNINLLKRLHINLRNNIWLELLSMKSLYARVKIKSKNSSNYIKHS